MPTLKYLDDSYSCATAIKGADYIHLLDKNGMMVAAFDGIADFTGFTLENGSYVSPTADQELLVAVVRDDGAIDESGQRICDLATADHTHAALAAEEIREICR